MDFYSETVRLQRSYRYREIETLNVAFGGNNILEHRSQGVQDDPRG